MYYLRKWYGYDNVHPDGFEYFRHSDAAVKTVIDRKNAMESLLLKYGYGSTFPKKEVIITEVNVPSKRVGNSIGGESAQQNFLQKLAIIAQKAEIKAIHPYCVWDEREISENGNEYSYMGFYKPIPNAPPAWNTLRKHESADGWKMVSQTLGGKYYNEDQTKALQLPEGVDGAAFESGNEIVYALWAKTTKDMNETAQFSFSFPEQCPAPISVTKWDSNSKQYVDESISGHTVLLTGDVQFYKANMNTSGLQQIEDNELIVWNENGVLYLNAQNPIDQITIYNVVGQKVRTLFSQSQQVSVTNLPGGVLLLKAKISGKSHTVKILMRNN